MSSGSSADVSKKGAIPDCAGKFYEFFLTSASTLKLLQRYTVIRVMGSNSRGLTLSAMDTRTRKHVAIRYRHKAFDNVENANHTYREIKLFRSANHKNIVRLVNLFSADVHFGMPCQEVYIVVEKVHCTLTHVINMIRIGKMKLNHKHMSFMVYQILCAVKYLHDSNIIHLDLKPDNIGVSEKSCEVKLLDFGRPKVHDLKDKPYVVTRFYRAPEIVLGTKYDSKVDVWSIGCIMAELMSRKILFPGEHYFLQWSAIVKVLGKPGKKFLEKLTDRQREYATSAGPMSAIPMEQLFPEQECSFPDDRDPSNLENAKDFLKQVLVIDPDDRYTVEEALKHKYVNYWCDQSELTVPPIREFSGDNSLPSEKLNSITELIVNEVRNYCEHKDIFNL